MNEIHDEIKGRINSRNVLLLFSSETVITPSALRTGEDRIIKQ